MNQSWQLPSSYSMMIMVFAAFLGMISRSSSRGGDVRPTGVSDPAVGRAGSTIIMPSPPELEMVRYSSPPPPKTLPYQTVLLYACYHYCTVPDYTASHCTKLYCIKTDCNAQF